MEGRHLCVCLFAGRSACHQPRLQIHQEQEFLCTRRYYKHCLKLSGFFKPARGRNYYFTSVILPKKQSLSNKGRKKRLQKVIISAKHNSTYLFLGVSHEASERIQVTKVCFQCRHYSEKQIQKSKQLILTGRKSCPNLQVLDIFVESQLSQRHM